jgi:predicted permease
VVATVVSNIIFLAGAIFTLELQVHAGGHVIRRVCRAVASPILVASLAGLVWAQAGFTLPPVVASLLRLFSPPRRSLCLRWAVTVEPNRTRVEKLPGSSF